MRAGFARNHIYYMYVDGARIGLKRDFGLFAFGQILILLLQLVDDGGCQKISSAAQEIYL